MLKDNVRDLYGLLRSQPYGVRDGNAKGIESGW